MVLEAPEKRFFCELRELNAEFLSLAGHPDRPGGRELFGLEPALSECIGSLSAEQLDFVAGTPVLLAGFAAIDAPPGIGERTAYFDAADGNWLASTQAFSAGLMTYLWQIARRGGLDAAFCVGLSRDQVRRLAAWRFADIRVLAATASQRIEARFCHHPRFWPELIRAAGSGAKPVQRLLRLSAISLAISGPRPGVHRRSI